jgi:phage N-6-adenine-methyltransferase
MSEPIQKPGKSKQDYGTPWSLIRAIEARWGSLTIDLAARADNAKAPLFITPEEDSLKQDWSTRIGDGLAWLNPPFGDIAPWAAKCSQAFGTSIIMLTPASIGSEWFAEHCEGKAKIIGLRPRLRFEGCKDPYPKDCMLTLWNERNGIFGDEPDFQTWRWDVAVPALEAVAA